ncbi:hypothetical protein ACEUZ9_000900 [Paracoccus litorisediminis]|uniref:hypothetical protein n=1 Tax=Paracoccus litorisediminis TaxID=2006130 RepID=UPI003731BA0F
MQVTHLYFTIKAGLLDDRCLARAFRNGAKGGIIAEIEGTHPEDAIAKMRKHLDAIESGRLHARREDAATGRTIPSILEFASALRASTLSSAMRDVLLANARSGSSGIGIAGLKLLGSTGVSGMVGLLYAKATREIAQKTPVPWASLFTREPVPPGTACWSRAARKSEVSGNWIMHPEAREAVIMVIEEGEIALAA